MFDIVGSSIDHTLRSFLLDATAVHHALRRRSFPRIFSFHLSHQLAFGIFGVMQERHTVLLRIFTVQAA